jgi:hypothetical protein
MGIAFSLVCAQMNYVIGETIHLSGEANDLCDKLSRGTYTDSDASIAPTRVKWADNPTIRALLAWGDPKKGEMSIESFAEDLSSLCSLLKSLD